MHYFKKNLSDSFSNISVISLHKTCNYIYLLILFTYANFFLYIYIRIFNMSVNINEITEANSKEKLIFTITILDKAEKINAKK